MKKIYYIDSVLLIVSIVFFIISIKNINEFSLMVLFILFILQSIYINMKISIVRKYPPQHKISIRDIFYSIYLIWGKLYFLLIVIARGIYLENIFYQSLLLITFIFGSWLIGDYSYVYKQIIFVKGKKILPEDIIDYKIIMKSMDQIFLQATAKEGEILKFSLYKSDFDDFIKLVISI
ncbi:MAG: hypothetical protein ACOWWH_02865 [Eubacteriaceae bacterium]